MSTEIMEEKIFYFEFNLLDFTWTFHWNKSNHFSMFRNSSFHIKRL